MAQGFAIAFKEDPLAASPVISYFDGRGQTTDASPLSLNQAETYIDGELNEVDFMALVGNVQIANPDKYVTLARVDVVVTLI
jgi:hypothetical protein